jgi:hypothetical protein
MKYKIFIIGLFLFLSCGNQNLVTKDDKGHKVIVELREIVKTEIKDSDRRVKILQIIDEVEIDSQAIFKFYQEHDNRIARLNSNYETSREDLEKVIAQFNKNYDAFLKMLIQRRGEMRQLTSRDEWITIMDRESTFIPE